MRLSQLVAEAEIGRRGFLQSLATILASKGVSVNFIRAMTKHAQQGTPLAYIQTVVGNSMPRDPVYDFTESYQKFIKLAKYGKPLVGVLDDSDELTGYVAAADGAIQSLMSRATKVDDYGDGVIYLEVDNEQYALTTDDPGLSSWRTTPLHFKNFAQAWWRGWAQYDYRPWPDELARTLQSNGVDLTTKDPDTQEIIADAYRNKGGVDQYGDQYGDPGKYGLDQSYSRVQSIQSNADDRLANPMHQPFESLSRRLDAIFGD